MTDIKLIVGLGNPGEKYIKTRHNIGFIVVDLLAQGSGQKWKNFSGIAEVSSINSENGKVILAKPQQYMNTSGLAVKALLSYFDILPSQMIVVVDDFSLPLGKLRLRPSGSSGGHNGLSSIIENLDTPEFPRLRLGIGPVTQNLDPKDFVLGKFSSDEKLPLQTMIDDAVKAVTDALSLGFDQAVSRIGAK